MELPAHSVLNFQDALDAVSGWGRKYRFNFGISLTKSEIMIFALVPTSLHVPSLWLALCHLLSMASSVTVHRLNFVKTAGVTHRSGGEFGRGHQKTGDLDMCRGLTARWFVDDSTNG